MTEPAEEPVIVTDPRVSLAEWANSNDEWVRLIAAEVIASGAPLSESTITSAYQLFRQEKALDKRTIAAVAPLSTEAGSVEATAPLAITRLSEVQGVNALTPGAVIDPHEGLTILYGENGTGKTGYARIFKALAASRTAEEILGDIGSETSEPLGARIAYKTGGDEAELAWTGENGVSPFTRMSIFDSPSVTYHVDEDLEYVYVPAALALFNHVSAAIRAVQARIDARVAELNSGTSTLVARFPRESKVYPQIETLGASTDLQALKAKADTKPDVDKRLEALRRAVAALEANTISSQINVRQREKRILEQAVTISNGLQEVDLARYNELVATHGRLSADYEAFRAELFAAANLPADPDDTWSEFITAGEQYRLHLVEVGAHDAERCLYCRQTVGATARDLLNKYSAYLDDKISADLRTTNEALQDVAQRIQALARPDVESFIGEFADRDDKPPFYDSLAGIDKIRKTLQAAVDERQEVEADDKAAMGTPSDALVSSLSATSTGLGDLQTQAADRTTALTEKRTELNELATAAELTRSWSAIEAHVQNAKETDQLKRLKGGFSTLLRNLTELLKAASDQLINHNFDNLFIEECTALKAPSLKVQFVGREGRPQRRKVLSAKHRPSKILSEGEQKVLAIADFLAEARLGGITAPVMFDDPVSSLDHRRIDQVARRVTNLAEETQVIVFTHDIFFATTLLALCEKSKRCSYFHVTDEDGKGKVTRATGPRWDTLKNIRGEISKTIQAAENQEGEARAALVRTGYDWIRSWCEVFTETDLLQGVSQRYQPNIGMSRLANINTEKLPELIEKVTRIFDDACRFIDGHSQPLATLGVSPTLHGLEEHWKELQECKKINDTRSSSS